jgi:uncharacterized protein YdaU (DUF1376 family)
MSRPYMQFYPGDYLRDTRHLTTEQHGAYLLILMTMWNHGATLPNDPAKLARIAGMSPRRWRLVADEIMAFFDVDGDVISQKRLVEEHQKAASISGKRSASGKGGGEAKALKNNKQALANATDLPAVCQDTGARVPEPTPEPDRKEPLEKTTNVVSPADAGLTPSKYAFEATNIRLTPEHFEKWRTAFPHLALESELWALDEWAGQQPKWFNAVSNALAKKERSLTERIHMARVGQEAVPRRQSTPDPAL